MPNYWSDTRSCSIPFSQLHGVVWMSLKQKAQWTYRIELNPLEKGDNFEFYEDYETTMVVPWSDVDAAVKELKERISDKFYEDSGIDGGLVTEERDVLKIIEKVFGEKE